jgi:hypothetical protein
MLIILLFTFSVLPGTVVDSLLRVGKKSLHTNFLGLLDEAARSTLEILA